AALRDGMAADYRGIGHRRRTCLTVAVGGVLTRLARSSARGRVGSQSGGPPDRIGLRSRRSHRTGWYRKWTRDRTRVLASVSAARGLRLRDGGDLDADRHAARTNGTGPRKGLRKGCDQPRRVGVTCKVSRPFG